MAGAGWHETPPRSFGVSFHPAPRCGWNETPNMALGFCRFSVGLVSPFCHQLGRRITITGIGVPTWWSPGLQKYAQWTDRKPTEKGSRIRAGFCRFSGDCLVPLWCQVGSCCLSKWNYCNSRFGRGSRHRREITTLISIVFCNMRHLSSVIVFI